MNTGPVEATAHLTSCPCWSVNDIDTHRNTAYRHFADVSGACKQLNFLNGGKLSRKKKKRLWHYWQLHC